MAGVGQGRAGRTWQIPGKGPVSPR
jgi:hypothetical protein